MHLASPFGQRGESGDNGDLGARITYYDAITKSVLATTALRCKDRETGMGIRKWGLRKLFLPIPHSLLPALPSQILIEL
jgi:hypothetical protein